MTLKKRGAASAPSALHRKRRMIGVTLAAGLALTGLVGAPATAAPAPFNYTLQAAPTDSTSYLKENASVISPGAIKTSTTGTIIVTHTGLPNGTKVSLAGMDGNTNPFTIPGTVGADGAVKFTWKPTKAGYYSLYLANAAGTQLLMKRDASTLVAYVSVAKYVSSPKLTAVYDPMPKRGVEQKITLKDTGLSKGTTVKLSGYSQDGVENVIKGTVGENGTVVFKWTPKAFGRYDWTFTSSDGGYIFSVTGGALHITMLVMS